MINPSVDKEEITITLTRAEWWSIYSALNSFAKFHFLSENTEGAIFKVQKQIKEVVAREEFEKREGKK